MVHQHIKRLLCSSQELQGEDTQMGTMNTSPECYSIQIKHPCRIGRGQHRALKYPRQFYYMLLNYCSTAARKCPSLRHID